MKTKNGPIEQNEGDDVPRDPYLVALGRNITAARLMLKMPRLTMAELANITPASASLIELGMRNASINTLRKIAETLKTTPAALLPDGKDGMTLQLFVPDLSEAIDKFRGIMEHSKELRSVMADFDEMIARAERVQSQLKPVEIPTVDKGAAIARRADRNKGMTTSPEKREPTGTKSK